MGLNKGVFRALPLPYTVKGETPQSPRAVNVNNVY